MRLFVARSTVCSPGITYHNTIRGLQPKHLHIHLRRHRTARGGNLLRFLSVLLSFCAEKHKLFTCIHLAVWYKARFISQNFGYQIWFCTRLFKESGGQTAPWWYAIKYTYLAELSRLPWIFLGAPLIFNGAPRNIQGYLTGILLCG